MCLTEPKGQSGLLKKLYTIHYTNYVHKVIEPRDKKLKIFRKGTLDRVF